MDSKHVHYANKYPGGMVRSSDESLDAFDKDGRHCVALRKGGAGEWQDRSKQMGLPHEHDLSPIPKEARLLKSVGGALVPDDKYEERSKMVEKFMDDGRVLSCEQLAEKKGMKFDKDGSFKP